MPITTTAHVRTLAETALRSCGVEHTGGGGAARTPITGEVLFDGPIGRSVEESVTRAAEVFALWRITPAPVRGNTIKTLGRLLETHKEDLATLVQVEVGKIRSEALGEIQEMIDICEFAVGLSRQLYGLSIASERPGHRLTETWQPLGPVGVITAFNFPAAVWAWNAALAVVCGNPVIWKPSELTPLISHAVNSLAVESARRCGAPEDLFQLVDGERANGEHIAKHPGVALVSATGSTAMGRSVAQVVAGRFGRSLLELGGNNAAIVTPSADMNLAVRAMTFAAAGTAGQRCTTLRRVIVHESRVEELLERLGTAYASLPIGDPLDTSTLVGPLIHLRSLEEMQQRIADHQAHGGRLIVGGERLHVEEAPAAAYIRPAIVKMTAQTDGIRQETFAPLMTVLGYTELEEAIALNNNVPQGLASSIFTTDLREAEQFCGPAGSDCGIANVNIGPSGAEIGGAFGGEKETGGGRESGSDSWKAYMRRATNTVNYSDQLPLAQGVTFN
jgi:aldehyde dehydrogenase (NAD+)